LTSSKRLLLGRSNRDEDGTEFVSLEDISPSDRQEKATFVWGSNGSYQLALDGAEKISTPVKSESLKNVVSVSTVHVQVPRSPSNHRL
jgi:hypothetical protein